jgi:organic radical activating enzyme
MCPETGIPITATQPNARPARLAVPPNWFQRERVYLSPCDNGDAIKNKANLEMAASIALRHGYTLGIQMHKIVGLD